LLTFISVIVWSVSFLDQLTGFQTAQTEALVVLVAPMSIRLAQPGRISSSVIASPNSRLRTCKSISIGFGLQLLPGIPPAFAINSGDGEENPANR
jgi:hypothetical protein